MQDYTERNVSPYSQAEGKNDPFSNHIEAGSGQKRHSHKVGEGVAEALRTARLQESLPIRSPWP